MGHSPLNACALLVTRRMWQPMQSLNCTGAKSKCQSHQPAGHFAKLKIKIANKPNETMLHVLASMHIHAVCKRSGYWDQLLTRSTFVFIDQLRRKTIIHCAKNVVYASVYFCVYFAYTINIPRVVYISNIQLVFKNPQVTIIYCAYSRSIKNTQTTMNYANLDNLRKNRYEFRY